MGLADLYDRFQALITLDHRVKALEDEVATMIPRMEELGLAVVRLGGRIETVKAETLAEFYRQAATVSPPPRPPSSQRAALPPGRKQRRTR